MRPTVKLPFKNPNKSKVNITTRFVSILLMIGGLLFLFSCDSTKRVPQGSYLVNKVNIKGNLGSLHTLEIEPFIKQKPNRKAFGQFPINLWIYNQANPDKLKQKQDRYKAKMATINAQRIAQGKTPKSDDKLFFQQALMNIGEAPVIYDSAITKSSLKQLERLFKSKGYFDCTVSDTLQFDHKKVNITYKINAKTPYRIKKIHTEIEDKTLLNILSADTLERIISPGKLLDLDQLQKERDRITRKLNNHGYFAFSKEYIYFRIDTSFKSHWATVDIVIKQNNLGSNPSSNAAPTTSNNKHPSDSLKDYPHIPFTIHSITVQEEDGATDTIHYGKIILLVKGKPIFKPRLIASALLFQTESLYQIDQVEATYRKFSSLRAFKTVTIQFELVPSTNNQLNCKITLNPVKKQNFTIAAEGTNTGGDLGMMANISYQNKNLLGGAEIFELKIKGGLEVQQMLSQNKSGLGIPFNTKEFGPELSLSLPRFIINTKTTFSLISNYQESPDYNRFMNKITFGYTWRIGKNITHQWNPLEFGLIKVTLDPSFHEQIFSTNNILLENSYQPHIVPDGKYTFIYNDQTTDKTHDHQYFRFSFETSGNLFRGLFSLAKAPLDNNNSYEIIGIPFSQYLRSDVDYRFYKRLANNQSIVFRAAGGLGKTLDNLSTLPFEKSFYGGGSNDIRAWPIRTLGPGSYSGNTNYSQIGDMQLEANTEYRFKLLRQLNGAIFVDAGNIWLLHPNPTYAGGDFQWDRFYKEIAIGSGFGARFDFSFFIVRLDLGVRLRDPQLSENDRWVIQHLFDTNWYNSYEKAHGIAYSFFNFNIGIGYPF